MGRASLIEGRTVAFPDRRYWGTQAVANPSDINYTYSLGLFDLVTYKAISLGAADPAKDARKSPWFRFPVPPQVYDLSENAATTVVPTQNGGKFVESQGSIFKDLRLSGTVGLRPSPVDSNLFAGTGVPLTLSIPKTVSMFTNDDRGLPRKEITGFDDITFLRNLFRGYWDLKKSNEWARRTVMIWTYVKDSDIFIVEPMNFTATKDKSNPLSYTYNITLRTLYRFDAIILKENDPISAWQALNNAVSVLTQAIRDITTALNQIMSVIDYVVSLPFRILDSFMNETIGLLGAISQFRSLDERLSKISQEGLKKLNSDAKEIRRLLSKQEKSIADSGSKMDSFSGDPSRTGAPAFTLPGITTGLSFTAVAAIMNNPCYRAVNLIERATTRLRSLDSLFATSKQVVVNDLKNAYNKGGVPFTAGSPINVNNINIPSSAQEDVVGGNETLRSIAKRTMGDEAYYKMLAILNKLKPPYISAVPGDGVLTPGSKILIPKRMDSEDITGSLDAINTDASSEVLSPLGKKYGRDLKLSAGSSGTDFADLQVSQRGDLSTIEGVDNVRQAMVIKTSTEQGDLPLHPTFGAAYPVGTKVSLSQLHEFALNTRRTFLSDPRIAELVKMNTYAEGDIIHVSVVARLKQSDVTLPIEFSVRSA